MASTNTGKVWLITGCSTGFGKELALAALKRGDKVIATARSVARLSQLIEAGAHPLQLDVTSSLSQLEDLAKEAVAVYGRVDVLVNNAGYVLQGAIEVASPEETLAQFNTNVFGTLNVTRAFLPHLRERRSGVIAFIGSMLGWSGAAAVGLYSGTKYAIEGLAEALRQEVEPFGITVTVIEPGEFRTSALNAGTNLIAAQRQVADYEDLTRAVQAHLKNVDGKQPGDPVKGAQRIVDLLTLSGSAAERTQIPPRLALGKDAHATILNKCTSTLASLDEWKDLTLGTDHDDVVEG